jgi:hypothetical protein
MVAPSGRQAAKADIDAIYPRRRYHIEDDFSAVGDGITSDATAFQNAFNALSTNHRTILELSPDKTYKIDSAISVTGSKIRVIGNGTTIDATSLAAGTGFNTSCAFLVSGSLSATTTTVTSDLTNGQKQIPVGSTTGFSVDDIVLVKSSAEVWPVGSLDANTAKKGSLHRVRSIDDSTHLTVYDGMFFDFTAATTTVVKVNVVNDVVFEDVNIRMGGVNKAQVGVRMEYVSDCWWLRGSIHDAEDANIRWSFALGGGVRDADFSGATSPDAGSSGVTTVSGYGIAVFSACRDFEISGNRCRNNRHSVAGSGNYPPIHVSVVNNSVDGSRVVSGTRYDLECHEECLHWTFRGNRISGSLDTNGSGGMLVRGQNCTLDGNHIKNAWQYGILIECFDDNPNGMDGVTVINNVIDGARTAGIQCNGTSTATVKNAIIDGNVVRASAEGIRLTFTQGGSVSRNHLLGCGTNSSSALRLSGSATAGDYCSDIVIDGNRIDGAQQYGIYCQYAQRITLGQNQVRNITLSPIYLSNCSDVVQVGGYTEGSNTTLGGIIFDACTKGQVIGGRIHSTVSTTGAGVLSNGSSDISVIGAMVTGYNRPFTTIGTVDYLITTNINGRGCTTTISNGATNKVNTNNL